MNELKPCPFCGGVKVRPTHNSGLWVIWCSSCGANGPEAESEESAGAGWNAATVGGGDE